MEERTETYNRVCLCCAGVWVRGVTVWCWVAQVRYLVVGERINGMDSKLLLGYVPKTGDETTQRSGG